MAQINLNDVKKYVEVHIGLFHQKRLDGLKKLKLLTILKKKNPYLFRAKNLSTGDLIVRAICDAFISSNEETLFGDWLEDLAIYISTLSFNGMKSGIQGIDLELTKNDIRYIIAIKSGPNWGNSSQINKMKEDFRKAVKTLRTSNSNLNIRAINGCAYGKDAKPEKEEYLKLCGQEFWEFISGDDQLYVKLIEPLGHKAKEKNEEFNVQYSRMINSFIAEFMNEFKLPNGDINWKKLVEINSGKKVKTSL